MRLVKSQEFRFNTYTASVRCSASTFSALLGMDIDSR